jgi:nicotinic acid phosphoribosyltransferase
MESILTKELTSKTFAKEVKLPRQRIFETPRLLYADAYTIEADKFQAEKAKEKSVYYLTFRKRLHTIDQTLYKNGDDRIVFVGLPRILDFLFRKPITHEEIDETKRALEFAKATNSGLARYNFPEHLWRAVVDKYNGRPPIEIMAMPEGSVVYPNEPVVQISSVPTGFGEMAAWFESKLIQSFGATERVTQDQHFAEQVRELIKVVDPEMDEDQLYITASLQVNDFGDRSGLNQQESEELGMYHLYTWAGTDTFSGGYQAWKNSGHLAGIFTSVNALAHRNVQAFEFEGDCYTQMYERADDNEILSQVADCNDYYYAVEHYIMPLALRSKSEGRNITIVARPDSGDALAQVIWTVELAIKNGLFEERVINGKKWLFGTYLKFIEADGMGFKEMLYIMNALNAKGYAFYGWGVFGCGGGLRNNIKRDNLSAKYALCAIGDELKGVVKFSEAIGKTTLPGPFKILRDIDSLIAKRTIVFAHEDGENAMVCHFKGHDIYEPYGDIMDEWLQDSKARIRKQFATMPLTLETDTNHNYPASEAIIQRRHELLKKYAPSKDANNY